MLLTPFIMKKILSPFLLIPLFLLAACASTTTTTPTPSTGDKSYVGNSPEQCATIRFMCEKDSEYFSDDKGCGCQKKVVSTPPVASTSEKLALVDSVNTVIMESFPVQVTAVATGNLRNGCEKIGTIEKSDDQLSIKIHTKTEGEMCTQALIPFTERVKLNVAGWKKGAYKVDVNGVKADFTLASDNVLTEKPVTESKPDPSKCVDDGKPVCVKVAIQCIKAPCDPIWETLPNRCSIGTLNVVETKEGACDSPSELK